MIYVSDYRKGDERRILLKFEYNFKIKEAVKSIPGSKFSHTMVAWHIPYTKESWQQFIQLGLVFEKTIVHPSSKDTATNDEKIHVLHSDCGTGETCHQENDTDNNRIEIEPNSNAVSSCPGQDADILSEKTGHIKVEYQHGQFCIRTPYVKSVIDQIRSLQKAWWNSNRKMWYAKACMENHLKIQELWVPWTDHQFENISYYIQLEENPKKLFLFRVPEYPDHIMIKLSGYGVDYNFLKQLPERSYDKELKRWMLADDKIMLKKLTSHYLQKGVEIVNKLPAPAAAYTAHKYSYQEHRLFYLAKCPKQYHEVLSTFIDKLIQERYSWNTIKSYSGVLIKYLESLSRPVNESKTPDVNQFLSEIASKKISESEINRYISALKYYYQHVAFIPEVKIEQIRRPRKSLILPKILSVQQVNRIMESSDNLKHTTILYTLYSGGMRLGEILNLKVSNIQWDRNQIHIEGGKGKKDRLIMLSETLKELLRLYTDQYMPAYWLFEGQLDKRPYSGRSVQEIVRKAAKKAGILSKVTPHTLRHCFATHLHETGTSLLYIQELLGHKNIKTTLVYTHVSIASVTAIKSPLDMLKLNKFGGRGEKSAEM